MGCTPENTAPLWAAHLKPLPPCGLHTWKHCHLVGCTSENTAPLRIVHMKTLLPWGLHTWKHCSLVSCIPENTAPLRAAQMKKLPRLAALFKIMPLLGCTSQNTAPFWAAHLKTKPLVSCTPHCLLVSYLHHAAQHCQTRHTFKLVMYNVQLNMHDTMCTKSIRTFI